MRSGAVFKRANSPVKAVGRVRGSGEKVQSKGLRKGGLVGFSSRFLGFFRAPGLPASALRQPASAVTSAEEKGVEVVVGGCKRFGVCWVKLRVRSVCFGVSGSLPGCTSKHRGAARLPASSGCAVTSALHQQRRRGR